MSACRTRGRLRSWSGRRGCSPQRLQVRWISHTDREDRRAHRAGRAVVHSEQNSRKRMRGRKERCAMREERDGEGSAAGPAFCSEGAARPSPTPRAVDITRTRECTQRHRGTEAATGKTPSHAPPTRATHARTRTRSRAPLSHARTHRDTRTHAHTRRGVEVRRPRHDAPLGTHTHIGPT